MPGDKICPPLQVGSVALMTLLGSWGIISSPMTETFGFKFPFSLQLCVTVDGDFEEVAAKPFYQKLSIGGVAKW